MSVKHQEKKAPSERVNIYAHVKFFISCTCVILSFIVCLNQHSVYVAKQNKSYYLVKFRLLAASPLYLSKTT